MKQDAIPRCRVKTKSDDESMEVLSCCEDTFATQLTKQGVGILLEKKFKGAKFTLIYAGMIHEGELDLVNRALKPEIPGYKHESKLNQFAWFPSPELFKPDFGLACRGFLFHFLFTGWTMVAIFGDPAYSHA